MHVLVVSPKFHPVIGGGETYALNSVKRLHDAGITVSVAVEPHADRRRADYPFPVYEIAGLSDSSLNVISAPSGLYRLLRQTKPDILHVHGYFGLLAVALSNADKLPILASIHSTPVWGERIIGGMQSFEAELQFARGVIDAAKPNLLTAANEVYADAAKKVAEGRAPVKVLPYPVDVTFFFRPKDWQTREEFGLSGDDRLILTPSRIIERKGIFEVVRALRLLPSNYYLCLPGAVEPLDKEFWRSVCMSEAYRAVRKRILIPKRKITYDDMPLLYAASDIVAMPSYYEGAPVATVEAMASGRPFVGADSQGINSFIRHEKNGLLVPKKDANALAQAILRLDENKSLQQRLTMQARHDIEYLSWERQLPLLIDSYKSVTASPS
jgi:glycosyltransferase involved in cell wall biosynthesis